MIPLGSPAAARTVSLTVSIPIRASKDRVWKAMIDDIDHWWLPDYRIAPESKQMILEARAGGRFYEDAPGGGLLWYTVQMVSVAESIDMIGFLARRFGGPTMSLLHISLQESNGVTIVTIEDSLIGAFSDEMAKQTHAGWTALFESGLKPYAERPGP